MNDRGRLARIIIIMMASLPPPPQATQARTRIRPLPRSASTKAGIAAYRSSLTLDWLAAEDTRQRELVDLYGAETVSPGSVVDTNCVSYPRPSAGKVGRLLLELLKSLEGDHGTLITELVQALVSANILMEASPLEREPDLASLLRLPGDLAAEPHATFPRTLGLVWLVVTDAETVRRSGWCSIKKVTKYLKTTRPSEVARRMKRLDSLLAGTRFIIEDFIQEVTPLNLVTGPPSTTVTRTTWTTSTARPTSTTRSSSTAKDGLRSKKGDSDEPETKRELRGKPLVMPVKSEQAWEETERAADYLDELYSGSSTNDICTKSLVLCVFVLMFLL